MLLDLNLTCLQSTSSTTVHELEHRRSTCIPHWIPHGVPLGIPMAGVWYSHAVWGSTCIFVKILCELPERTFEGFILSFSWAPTWWGFYPGLFRRPFTNGKNRKTGKTRKTGKHEKQENRGKQENHKHRRGSVNVSWAYPRGTLGVP